MLAALAFCAVALLLLLLGVLAFFRLGALRLESPLGVARDGLPTGALAPAWELPDARGRTRTSPNPGRWQLLLFADHSLIDFEELAESIKRLAAREDELDVLVITRADLDAVVMTVEVMDFDVPVVAADEDLYDRYNVRVSPFVMIVDSAGRVRSSAVVNWEETLLNMWRLAHVPLDAATGAVEPREATAP